MSQEETMNDTLTDADAAFVRAQVALIRQATDNPDGVLSVIDVLNICDRIEARLTETVTIPRAEYEHLLECTAGVEAYREAARGGLSEGEAQAAARERVQSELHSHR